MNTSGTSIQDLYSQQKNDQFSQHKQMNNLPQYNNQQPNIYPAVQQQMQQQQMLQQQMQQQQMQQQMQQQQTNNEIEELIKDINNGLPIEDTDYNYNYNKPNIKESYKQKIFNYIPIIIREPILLIIIYYLMSQQFFKDYVGKYINKINQDESGKISNIGIILYGTLLATIFSIIKYLILP